MSNIETIGTVKMIDGTYKICLGCSKVRANGTCTVYKTAPSLFRRKGECPFNQKKREVSKLKRRVGQQKQRKKI